MFVHPNILNCRLRAHGQNMLVIQQNHREKLEAYHKLAPELKICRPFQIRCAESIAYGGERLVLHGDL